MEDRYIQKIDSSLAFEIFKGLDLTFFAKLFNKMTGAEYCLIIFDGTMNPIVSSNNSILEKIVTELAEDRTVSQKLSFSPCFDLGAMGKLIVVPLEKIENAEIGLLATLVPNSFSPEQIKEIEETLGDIAEAIYQVCRPEYDLIDMTNEVSIRYEELNIVYGFGNIIRQRLRGKKLYKTLMKLCVDRMEVDLAVFIHPDQNSITYSANSGKKFSELDLLLTRMKNEVFRFVASSKKTLIINRSDDQRRNYIWTGMPYKFLAAPVIFQKDMKALLIILRDDDGLDFSNSDRKLMEVTARRVRKIVFQTWTP